MSALLLALLPAVAGCSFDASFDGTRYRCGEGGACPTGYVCVADECVPPVDIGIDAAAADDGNTSTDARTDASTDAASTVRFSDTFDDGALGGWTPWDHPGCTVAEANGYLELNFSGTGTAYCGADTDQTYDLRTGSTVVEIVEAPLVSNFEAYLTVFDATQQILMIRSSAGLRMQLKLNGQDTAPLTIPNDASYRFWRIRWLSGTTYWETSPDGVVWTQRHSTTTVLDVRSMRVELSAGHYTPGPGSPVRARFDRLTIE